MKKLFFAAMLLMTSVVSANADNDERAINVAQLPQTAQSFLTANFSGKTVAFAVEERKFFGTEYEVVYTDRTEVSFRSDGEWESVETKYEQVPSSVVPAQIADFVAKGGFEGLTCLLKKLYKIRQKLDKLELYERRIAKNKTQRRPRFGRGCTSPIPRRKAGHRPRDRQRLLLRLRP